MISGLILLCHLLGPTLIGSLDLVSSPQHVLYSQMMRDPT